MEAWQRFERWVLLGLGTIFAGLFVYIVWPRTLVPPIPELGKPISVDQTPGGTRAVFVLNAPIQEAMPKIDYKLINRGFKRPPDSWDGLLMRRDTESIRVMQGAWQSMPNGTYIIRWDPNVTTVVYSIRRPTWWRLWRQTERDWAMRKQRQSQAQMRQSVSLTPVF